MKNAFILAIAIFAVGSSVAFAQSNRMSAGTRGANPSVSPSTVSSGSMSGNCYVNNNGAGVNNGRGIGRGGAGSTTGLSPADPEKAVNCRPR